MDGLRFGKMGTTCGYNGPVTIIGGQLILEMLLNVIQSIGRNKLPNRKIYDVVGITGNADKLFAAALPGGDFFRTDCPLDRKTITFGAFKIEIAPSLRLTGPHQ